MNSMPFQFNSMILKIENYTVKYIFLKILYIYKTKTWKIKNI